MPYIGKQPLTGAYQLCDTITTSATATYNLLVGGSAVIPGSANNCIVSLNGVVQAPVGAFTVSGSQITFASALTASDVIDFILILGNVFDIGTPTNGAVTNSSLNSNVITGQTAETTVAGGDLVLLYDDSASALRKMTRTNFVSGLAGITMSQQWRLTADLTNSANPISSNLEIVDTDGYGGIGSSMTESSGTFTFPSTGIYLINFNTIQQVVTTADYCQAIINTTTDNSTYSVAADGRASSSSGATAFNTAVASFMFDVTDVTTHKVRFQITQAESTNKILGNTGNNLTYMTFIRLGDT